MADTATIDLLTHTSTTAASTGSAKFSAFNSANSTSSSNFAAIFNTANKTYSANANSFNNQTKIRNPQPSHTTKNSNDAATTKNTNTAATTDKNTDTTTVNRKDSDSKNNSQNSSQNSSSTDNETKVTDNTTKTSTSDTKTTNTNNTTTTNSTDNTATSDIVAQEKTVADDTANIQAALQAATEEISVPVEQIATTIAATTEPTEDSKNITDTTATKAITDIIAVTTTDTTTDASAAKKDSQSTQNSSDATDLPKVDPSVTIDNIINILAQNTSTTDLTSNTVTTNNVAPAQNTQDAQVAQAIQPNIGNNLSDSTKILNSLASQSNAVKSQAITQTPIQVPTQTQQSPSSNATQGQQTTQAEAVVTPAIDVQEVDTQIPVIAVNTEELASTVNVKTDSTDVKAKQNVKDILDKASLTQETLDKTNAKIVNVENSNLPDANKDTNSHLNLRKQNTEDQVAKLAVESNSNTSSTANVDATTNLSSITTDTTPQTNFAKTLSNVQTQPQQANSKEISDTEILSQVNNKLSSLKDDGTSKVSIVLRPENLGKINLELVNTKEGLTAQLTTDNPQVKQILDKSLDSLKDNLSNQGVGVSSVTVKVDETQKQSTDMYSFDREQSNAGNQGSSNNAQNQDQDKNEFSFDEEIDNIMTTTNSETGTAAENENLVSAGSYKGNVDYKV